ncbi:hypothetical protein [Methylobacterium sp. WL1]|uniref:hypothetical protein n=1 Tax=Methylobacterium sp. WL1 TaxID=2603276 RepID=UPI0011C1DE6F|nr:hypothetical protein [Methylobacterium sp. WL1]QEE41504.1 hypothetical protein FVA80_23725 [Methylobacterium sp. WL1]
MPATIPTRSALALGVILPLALVGGASAQQQGAGSQSSWVDPPARSAPSAAAKLNPADQAKRAVPETEPVRQAAKPEPADDGLPKSATTKSATTKSAATGSAATQDAVTRAAGPKRAAALERPHARQASPRYAAHPRRLADTPAAVAPASAASGQRAAVARALAANYLATVSSSGDTMVGAAPHFYGSRVRFYGHPVTLAGLVAEKRSFVQRWPERRYEPRTIRTACDAETCTIRTIVDFRTANPDRGAVSTGAAELVLEVSFAGTRPVIVGESGRVLHRSVQAGTLAPSPGKA